VPTIKLTKSILPSLKAPDPSGKQKLIWDSELKGFGVLLSGTTTSRAYVAQRTLPDGRTRRITIGGLAEVDLKKARDQAAALIQAMRLGEDPKATRKVTVTWTLRSGLDAYIAARKDLKPKSASYYRSMVETNLAAWLELPLSAITPEMVEARHGAIQREVAARYSKPGAHYASDKMGGHTANMSLRLLGVVWNFVAKRDKTLPPNPLIWLEGGWYAEGRRERIVTESELPQFYRAVVSLDNSIFRDLILFIMFSGTRRGEACSLHWDHIDFSGRTIRIPGKNTKSGRSLNLPMSSYVSDLLVARRALGNAGGWVFPSYRGHINDPTESFEQIAAACGVRVSSHDLRRTFATVAASCNLSPWVVKGLINHSLGRDVTAGYVIMSVEHLREPLQIVTDKLLQLCQIELPQAKNIVRLG
jgi:integrase